MSLPSFPKPKITRDDAINQILSSIAMEELGISHILNAEGEKIQYALGTLEGTENPQATIDEVLAVNESVQRTLQATAQNQMILKNKMAAALSASNMPGPPGPPGPKGDPGIEIRPIFVDDYIDLPDEEKRNPVVLWVIYPEGFL